MGFVPAKISNIARTNRDFNEDLLPVKSHGFARGRGGESKKAAGASKESGKSAGHELTMEEQADRAARQATKKEQKELLKAAAKEVINAQAALQGASDIIAELISDNADYRTFIRKATSRDGKLISKAKDTETSLYIAITNKISIADMKNNYARLQTIAHEVERKIPILLL